MQNELLTQKPKRKKKKKKKNKQTNKNKKRLGDFENALT